jgi:ISXO2-like transposase domain
MATCTSKTPVVALVERDGMIRSAPVERIDFASQCNAVQLRAAANSTIITDELSVYKPLKLTGMNHEKVYDGKRKYARKRAERIEHPHEHGRKLLRPTETRPLLRLPPTVQAALARYVAESVFRWNHRQRNDSERREAAIKQAPGKRLKYKTPATTFARRASGRLGQASMTFDNPGSTGSKLG